MLKWVTKTALLSVVAFSSIGFATTVAHAQTLQSNNYTLTESSIGSDGPVQSSSNNFTSRSSIGDLSVGRADSGNFQVKPGSKTSGDPALKFSFEDSTAELGSFTASTATVTTSSFSVVNYTSYGYVVQLIGPPPTSGSHVIDAMSETAPSQPGIDQFGVNLVANTDPTSVGANPDNGDFGFGSAATNYGTPNEYRYVSGETIAQADKSSGKTTYTITYLVNVAPLKPGGQYTSDQTLIVTGTY